MGLTIAVPGIIASIVVFYAIFANSSGPAFNYWNDLGAHRTFGEVASRAGHDLALIPGSIFEAVVGLESVYGMGFVLAAVIAVGAVRSWKRGGRLAVLYFILYFLYVAMGEEPLPRYVIPLLPLVYLFMFEGFAAVLTWVRGVSASPRAMGVLRGALACLAGVVIFANVFYDGARDCAQLLAGLLRIVQARQVGRLSCALGGFGQGPARWALDDVSSEGGDGSFGAADGVAAVQSRDDLPAHVRGLRALRRRPRRRRGSRRP